MIAVIREIIFGLEILLLYFALETDASSEEVCHFNGRNYRRGESWHPYLEPEGTMYCIVCTCSENAKVNCNQMKCPVLKCPNPVRDLHQCCSRCPDSQTSPGNQASVNSSCQYNGTTYQHGDIFTSSELFPSKRSNQCTKCSCSEGQIYCGLVTCPELLCASPETVPDSCCQVCRDSSSEAPAEEHPQLNRGVRHSQQQCGQASNGMGSLGVIDAPSGSSLEPIPRHIMHNVGGGTTVQIILKEKHEKPCVHNGRTYSHGEVWHPTFRSFLPLPCILCTCKDGKQDCQRITCPDQYACAAPESVEGKCCRVCPEDRVHPANEIDTTSCRVSIYMFVPPSSENPRDNLRKIAIERESSADVEIYSWKQVNEIFHLVKIQKINKQAFKQEMQNFRLISRTNEAYWNMFLV
ncbi:chordin-like protein 2 [Tiliqua scincoides]|uniref:chordin-like protein 2 n=1 Tax=Tiliqua scincoides TaxID=71010 RepID=UPI003462F334